MITLNEVRVCNLNDLEPDKPHCFRVATVDVFVVRHKGEVYAIQNRCGHMSAPLNQGEFTDGLIVCALHGAGFRVDTGEVEWKAILPPPISEYIVSENPRIHHFGELIEAIDTLPVKVYPVTVKDDEVYITIKVDSVETAN
ncbi:MAG: Rieske 2Fe-2S domain-containing protein [Chloroflexota bacterium]